MQTFVLAVAGAMLAFPVASYADAAKKETIR
jgi:hypothetical protein